MWKLPLWPSNHSHHIVVGVVLDKLDIDVPLEYVCLSLLNSQQCWFTLTGSRSLIRNAACTSSRSNTWLTCKFSRVVGIFSLRRTHCTSLSSPTANRMIEWVVTEMYGFQGGSKPATIAANVKLARELKECFTFVCRVSFFYISFKHNWTLTAGL